MPIKIKKYIAFFLLFFTIGGFVVGTLPQPAKAQWITTDMPSLGGNIWKNLTRAWDKISSQMLATAFKQSLGTFLKKLAYDSAVYVASAGSGQKSLVNPFKGNYLLDLAEGATGEFIDELAQKSGFASALGTSSLCEPVDLTMKANLLMSFKKPKEPPAPKCSLTKIAKAAQKSAQDNLLELNAGVSIGEEGFSMSFRTIDNDQVLNGTAVQTELTSASQELGRIVERTKKITGELGLFGNSIDDETLYEYQMQLGADGELGALYVQSERLSNIAIKASACLQKFQENAPVCGNGFTVPPTEECDDANQNNNDACTNNCKFKTVSSCNPDGTIDASEVCDPTAPLPESCQSLGFASGSLICNGSCEYTLNCTPYNTATSLNVQVCQTTECADFNTAFIENGCNRAATLSSQYASQLLSSVQPIQAILKDLEENLLKIGGLDSKGNMIDNDKIQDIANAFNPEANELGQFGKIQEALSEKTQAQLEHEKLKTLAEGACKGVTKPISGEVVTPASATCATINQALEKSTKGQETFTGTIADAFGIFVNTLTSKLMERYFKQGLSMVFDRKGLKDCKGGKDICGDKTEDILRSGASLGGKAAAEKALGGLLTASIETGGQQDILSILASCPPEQPALNNCIIDEPFRRAIERQFTVKEAMEAYKKSGGSEGLDPKKPFGYILVGTAMDEPDFKNGYPYRSILYLRKYRIIPVGWELAAQYIKDIEAVKQVHTLDNVVDGFNDPTSPFFGLADPAWVLKSPTVFCARQGPGPELLSSELMCEKIANGVTGGQCESDDYQARKVSRKTWCADEQTCLEEGESGDCKRYGYCTLEKPSWKLGGTQCDKPFASCEGYTNSITKANYTILENTLNKSDCSQSNVGCQWYCQDAPKMCIGGTRGGQPCGVNNDCASIYCSVGTCVSSGIACSYDNDCGSGATGFCSNNNVTPCTTATVGTDCGVGNQCILCNTGARACVNGDTPGAACANNAQCGRGVVDGVCEEGGVWSCQTDNLVVDGDMEASGIGAWNTTGGCIASIDSKSTITAHTGSQSMYLAYDSSGVPGVCQGRGQSVTLKAGKTYTLEAWVKTDGGPSNGYIYNTWPDAYLWYDVDSPNDWQHVSHTFIAAADAGFQFGFRIRDNFTTANGVYVDDVRLYEGDRVNLDRDVKKCEAKDAGCNQFIKVLPGTNLIGNSGFEEDADLSSLPLTIPSGLGGGYANRWFLRNNGTIMDVSIDHTFVHSGKNSLYIKADPESAPDLSSGVFMGDSTVLPPTPSAVPSGFVLDPQKIYTVSAWIYVKSPNTSTAALSFGHRPQGIFAGRWRTFVTNQLSSQWERISVTITPEFMLPGNDINSDSVPDVAPNEIRIHLNSGDSGFYIDDLQLEEGDTTSSYVQYGSSNQAYLNGRRLSCLKQEVGCNLYTPTDGSEPIPAVVKTKDQCPAECAGYASFQELPTFFAPSGSLFENLIPKTASSCPASAEGCEEFTNLDTVASGGEAKEYYTKLRQCAKPGTTTEATFYTWEGSEEAGFQLRAWRLKADAGRPYTTDGFVGCVDPANPDCRIFYDQTGTTFPEELSSTVFISNDCHPLRKTIEGSEDDCTDSGGYLWEDPDGDLFGTCFYNAIPSQGLKCQAKYAGCREYRGAAGNNLRVLLNDDFEDLTSQGWTPSSLSNESLTIGGRSYYLEDIANSNPPALPNNWQNIIATKNVADLVAQDKIYILEFWAKRKDTSGIATTLNARFFGTNGYYIFFQENGVPVDGEWNKYALGPILFDRPLADNNTETLEFFAREEVTPINCDNSGLNPNCIAEFYLDNIVLREITDNPYLIKDSWKTPVSCLIEPEITKTIPTLPTILSADITAVQVGDLIVGNSNGFDSPSGALAIDGEIIEYSNLVGNVFTISARGARKTISAAHLATASVWPVYDDAQLGCKEYTDRLNQKTYLRSFDYLCGEDKVGCTEMFNTYNSRSMYNETLKSEYIPRDAVEYIVDNPKIYCNASFKGCEKLGQPALGPDQSVSSWGETYLINDPDQYDQIACESNENMCSEFITRGGGTMYFKDPKEALCEYQSPINIGGEITKGWFKKGVIPASTSGLYILPDGGYAHPECINASGGWDETKWTYSCPNDQVGCTEYQTPAVSTRQTGSQYIQLRNNGAPSGTTFQSTGGGPIISYRFNVLESGSYNLSLSTQNWNSGTRGDDIFNIDDIRHFLAISVDGIQKASLNSTSAPLAPPALLNAQLTTVSLGNLERGNRTISINWPNDWNDAAGFAVGDSNLQINSLILSKSAGNNYYNLEQGVDTSSCTGVVDPEKGCVAFYDATNSILNIKSSAVSGNAFAPAACQKCSLDATSCSTSPTCKPDSENCCCKNNAAVTNPCDSNTILKVKADRQCAEWLACTESEKTTDSKGNIIEMCKKRQACYKTGDGVECASDGLVNEIKQNQTFDDPVAIDVFPAGHAGVVADANLRSGYFKAGAHWTRICQNNTSLSCQVDADCGAGLCIDRQKMVCSLNTGKACTIDSDCLIGEGICGAFIEGYYPYSAYDGTSGGMTTIGGLYNGGIAFEDDFETYQPGKILPQCSTNADTGCTDNTQCKPPPLGTNTKDEGTCLNYWSATAPAQPKATNKEFKFGGQSLLITEDNISSNPIISKSVNSIINPAITIKSATLPRTGRNLSCATTTTNIIYCLGGTENSGISDQILEYNPATDSITTKSAVLPSRRFQHSCAINPATNLIYCFGGNEGLIRLNQITEYNPITDSIIVKSAVLPSTRYNHSCVTNPITNLIYCLGGTGADTRVIEYDPVADSVAIKSAALSSFKHCAINPATSLIYCFGGSAIGSIYEYNPVTDAIAVKSAVLPSQRLYLSCATNPITNLIYCLGGADSSGVLLNQISEYNPATDTVAIKSAVLPTARINLFCATNPATGRIYCFGGNTSSTELNQIIEYDPSLDAGAGGSAYGAVLAVWVNTKELLPVNTGPNPPSLRVDVTGAGTLVEQRGAQDWTKYIVPFTTTLGSASIQIYMVDNGDGIKAGSKAYIDMISLAPVLEIQNPVDKKTLPDNYAASTASAYSDRSCRIFAKPDALSCKYRERNTGREIQGWRGFCAESDPKNPEYCLQWWPIDLISGEDISKF